MHELNLPIFNDNDYLSLTKEVLKFFLMFYTGNKKMKQTISALNIKELQTK